MKKTFSKYFQMAVSHRRTFLAFIRVQCGQFVNNKYYCQSRDKPHNEPQWAACAGLL